MITKADVGALQAKLAAAHEELRRERELRKSEVAAVQAERDRDAVALATARQELSAALTEGRKVARVVEYLQARVSGLEANNKARQEERQYLAEQVETYMEQAKSLSRQLDAETKTGDSLCARLEKAQSENKRILAEMEALRSASNEALQDSAALLKKALREIERLNTLKQDSAALLEQAQSENKRILSEMEALRSTSNQAMEDSAALLRKAEREIGRLKSVKPEPQVIVRTETPDPVVIEKTICEREPADIAEIERLKAELAACQSGQAGE